MQPPKIDNSTKEERQAYVLDAWKCLHDCEACGKCRILKGRDAEMLYADYIEGKRSYMDITLEIRNRSIFAIFRYYKYCSCNEYQKEM